MPRHKVVSLRGRSIVLTGFLWKPQEEVKRRIRRAGGHIQEDVSRTTDILIRGRPNTLYKAADREMGTKLLEVEALDAQGHHVHLIWHDDLHWLLAKRRPAICGRLRAAQPPTKSGQSLGFPYVPVDDLALRTTASHIQRDLDAIERGLRGHAATQNALADAVSDAGLEPLSPEAHAPNYDLAWYDSQGGFVVAEVKSLNDSNETQQIRLGLGQVLDYQHTLTSRARSVTPVLAVERRPRSKHWLALCRAHGVQLVWPATMHLLFSSPYSKSGSRRRRP
jgi:hypothetical protein